MDPVPQTGDGSRTGQLVQRSRWLPAATNNTAYQSLHTAIQDAAAATRRLADIAGIPRRPGLADAATRRAAGDISATRLARQWYQGPKLREPPPIPRRPPPIPTDPTRQRRGPRL